MEKLLELAFDTVVVIAFVTGGLLFVGVLAWLAGAMEAGGAGEDGEG